MGDPERVAVDVGHGHRQAPVMPASVRARSIISNRSPAVNGFSVGVRRLRAPDAEEERSRPALRSRIAVTTPRWPRWNGWNRPTSRPRTPSASAGSVRREVLDVVEELVDVRAAGRQVEPAVAAARVVERAAAARC